MVAFGMVPVLTQKIGAPLSLGINAILLQLETFARKKKKDYSDHFLSGKDLVIEEITYVGPNYYITDNGDESLNWRGIIGMIILDTMVTTSIIIIIIFATKCYRVVSALSQSFNHSKSYRNLQSQLLNSLVAQIIIPVILMQGPALYLFTFPILHMGNEYLGELFCTTVAIYPVLDPLPTLFMIQHYRKALIDSVTPSERKSAQKKLKRIKSVTANIANVEN
ncbi:hypothetical protein L5515_005749 [Caenorhabditis briggsae]|uniref:Uncharacterized protein n=1 Tax=Caenorhabditis briggsae TaxID=6238 RepID=A0AAE9JHV1_CAEBR|nr:hypothetical protein L5515_005749 [Caenorhabditis briggsae]